MLTFERTGRDGNPVEAVLTVTLDGAMINAGMSVGGGRFSLTGSGKKQVARPPTSEGVRVVVADVNGSSSHFTVSQPSEV